MTERWKTQATLRLCEAQALMERLYTLYTQAPEELPPTAVSHATTAVKKTQDVIDALTKAIYSTEGRDKKRQRLPKVGTAVKVGQYKSVVKRVYGRQQMFIVDNPSIEACGDHEWFVIPNGKGGWKRKDTGQKVTVLKRK